MRAGVVLAALAVASPVSAEQRIVTVPSAPLKLEVEAMPLGALVTLLMRDVMQVPYVIAADVLTDTRPISVKFNMKRDEIPIKVIQFLRSMGLTVVLRGGTVYVSKAPIGEAPPPLLADNAVLSGSYVQQPPSSAGPVATAPMAPAPQELPESIAIIRPAHRSVTELTQIVQTAVPGLSVAARSASEPNADAPAQIAPALQPDELVLSGDFKAVALAVKLARAVDRPRPMVQIRAVIFEVRSTESRRSALAALLSLGGFRLGSGDTATGGDQFVRIATGGLNAVLSATSGDGRFRIIAEPSLAILSGTTGSINSGADVPTIGALTFPENGPPVRSIEYRSSGLSMTVTPRVRGGEIELAVQQERSSFGRTQTGVSDSPTLTTSRSSATIAVAPGETIALAGLDVRSNSTTRSGFLGGLLGSRQKDTEESQLLLVLQADIIGQQRDSQTQVQWIGKRPEGSAEDLGPLREPAEQAVPCGASRTSTVECRFDQAMRP